ncbi:MAG: hypothetical protein ACRDOF_09225 [Gaiellaceae bacterium]
MGRLDRAALKVGIGCLLVSPLPCFWLYNAPREPTQTVVFLGYVFALWAVAFLLLIAGVACLVFVGIRALPLRRGDIAIPS